MQEVNSPIKRVYFDLPTEVHALMQKRAKEAGVTQRAFLCALIEAGVKGGKRTAKK